ncbi:MAG TPA: lysylphosphatidylglycerol synthase transmembrane domain-containing protein [Bacteroidia bacterium]|nr:lysylphosphatidylglycerol synthase transmembrane domain-containing protein [Bacteroidia bacterium]
MEQSKRNISKKTWLLVKFIVAAAALGFIYKAVLDRASMSQWWEIILVSVKEGNHPLLMAIVLVFMLLNWSVEALKWKRMIGKIEKIGFGRSLEAVFSGLTVSFFTPNRVGEYAGRVFHLGKADRIEGTIITVIENYSQLLVTLITGSVGTIIYLHLFVSLPSYLWTGVSILLVLFSTVCLLLFLNVSVLESVFRKLKLPASWDHYLRVFSFYTAKELWVVIGLAGVRYLIFSSQFYLLLLIFGIQLPFLLSFLLISMTYFVMSVVPTIGWLELGVRGAVATYFFSPVTTDPVGVVNASITLWLINLVIPALVGCFFVFGFKLGRRREA